MASSWIRKDRSPLCHLFTGAPRTIRRRLVHAQFEMVELRANSESNGRTRNHERRRRRSARRLLSQFRPGLWRPENSQQILYGVAIVRTLPCGYLQAVAKLGSPFF